MWSKDADVAISETYSDPDAQDDDVFFTNETKDTAKADFTVNGQKGMWRALSAGEWQYLIEKNGSLWTTINEITGLIVFCDGYSGSKSGLEEIPDGCAFLPAAGFRFGDEGDESIIGMGFYGYYWSASPCTDIDFSFDFYFGRYDVSPFHDDFRDRAQSVRLVADCK